MQICTKYVEDTDNYPSCVDFGSLKAENLAFWGLVLPRLPLRLRDGSVDTAGTLAPAAPALDPYVFPTIFGDQELTGRVPE